MSQSALTRYHAGLEAERCVARDYLRKGCIFLAHRFRGEAGEIDLILRDGTQIVFVEVKKSATHGQAIQALSSRQQLRIQNTALEYLGQQPNGLDTDVRFDVATVDAHGNVKVCRNALIG